MATNKSESECLDSRTEWGKWILLNFTAQAKIKENGQEN